MCTSHVRVDFDVITARVPLRSTSSALKHGGAGGATRSPSPTSLDLMGELVRAATTAAAQAVTSTRTTPVGAPADSGPATAAAPSSHLPIAGTSVPPAAAAPAVDGGDDNDDDDQADDDDAVRTCEQLEMLAAGKSKKPLLAQPKKRVTAKMPDVAPAAKRPAAAPAMKKNAAKRPAAVAGPCMKKPCMKKPNMKKPAASSCCPMPASPPMLGCSKCRYLPRGCWECIQRARRAGVWLR